MSLNGAPTARTSPPAGRARSVVGSGPMAVMAAVTLCAVVCAMAVPAYAQSSALGMIPEEGITVQKNGTQVTIDWQDAENAADYYVLVDPGITDPRFTEIIRVSDSIVTIDLPPNVEYTISVAPRNSQHTHPARVFATVTVQPPDTTAPVITLNGPAAVSVTRGDAYSEQGATCTDERDPRPALTISGAVDTNTDGSYVLTYACTDASGNAAETLARTVTVAPPPDTTAPVITLNGPAAVSVTRGDAYSEQGATCTDERDPRPALTISGAVDTNTDGSYVLTYACTDASGNAAETLARTVTVAPPPDTTAPVITLNGPASVFAILNGTYAERGATCTDDTDASPRLADDSAGIDTSILSPPPQNVTHTCTDASGNTAVAVRSVTVVDRDATAPVITLNGPASVWVIQNGTYSEQGATCTDDTDASPRLADDSAGIDTSILSPPPQNVTHTCTDASGNTAVAVRSVTVVDRDATAPVITLNGPASVWVIQNGTYSEQGATCTDEVDASPALTISGTVDTSVGGSHVLTYACTDASGNAETLTRAVTVLPVAAPSGNAELVNAIEDLTDIIEALVLKVGMLEAEITKLNEN